jgi:hypothetical protein
MDRHFDTICTELLRSYRQGGLFPRFSGDEHAIRRKATPAGGCSDIRKIGVCLRVGGLAGVPGNGQNPLG